MHEDVEEFLALGRIAVAGVSRSTNQAANLIYRKLRATGYEVFAVNPNSRTAEGDDCYANLAAIPDGVYGVVIATHPHVTLDIVRQCVELDIRHVWMHRSFGQGSYSVDAADLCRRHGIRVIPGGCPMMFCDPVDVGHRCMRWFLRLTGAVPRAA